MIALKRLAVAAGLLLSVSTPTMAHIVPATPAPRADGIAAPPLPAPTSETGASGGTDKAVIVTGRKRSRRGLMGFLFGPNRRRGGFFANLLHPVRPWWATPSHRQSCKRRFRSYDPHTNRYRSYSGVRRRCTI